VLGQLVAETKNYFGKKHFDAMKPGSIFVNTARYVLPPYPDLSLAQRHSDSGRQGRSCGRSCFAGCA
jgi:hypothetical protein